MITDRAVKARVLRSAISALQATPSRVRNPNLRLPEIAHTHQLTLEDVREIVQAHGWPRPSSMARAVEILERTDALGTTASGEIVDEAHLIANDAGEQAYEVLPLELLHPDPANVRDDLGDLAELAKSITEVGILQPIVTRRLGDKLIIVMGHRRHAAAKLAGLHRVPVLIRPGTMDPDEVLAAMIIENGQRLDLDPVEEARALARLKRNNRATDAELAGQISKSQGYVSGRLALLSLTPPQQAAVRAGTLPIARAVQLGREQGGITRTGAVGKKSGAHLTWHHPLAERVALSCETLQHSKHSPGRPGGVGCGSCWEDMIRADERTKVEAAAQ